MRWLTLLWLLLVWLAACAAPETKQGPEASGEMTVAAAEVESARMDARLRDAEASAQAARNHEKSVRGRFDAGTVDESTWLESVGPRILAETVVARRKLELEETSKTGRAVDWSISARTMGGRDFALERYQLEQRRAEVYAKNAEALSRFWKGKFDAGVAPWESWRPFQGEAQAARAEVKRWTQLAQLRATGAATALTIQRAREIQQLSNVAIAKIHFDTTEAMLDSVQQRVAQGLGTTNELQNAKTEHREAQVALDTARRSGG